MVVSLFFLTAALAKAETSELAEVRREVEELRRTVEHLDTRVESLERQLPSRNESQTPMTAPTAAAPAVSIREGWRRITRGMTVDLVEALLGRPQRTVDLSSGTMWYYSYPDVGSGSVVFARDGTVVDWQTPPFGGWWRF